MGRPLRLRATPPRAAAPGARRSSARWRDTSPRRRSWSSSTSTTSTAGARGSTGRRSAEAVRAWIERAGGGTVALPAGAGWTMSRLRRTLGERVWWRFIGERPGPPQHPDHVFARDAALEAVAGAGVRCCCTRSCPTSGARPRTGRSPALGATRELFELQVDREEKARRIAAYASQVEHISPAARPARRPRGAPRYRALLAPRLATSSSTAARISRRKRSSPKPSARRRSSAASSSSSRGPRGPRRAARRPSAARAASPRRRARRCRARRRGRGRSPASRRPAPRPSRSRSPPRRGTRARAPSGRARAAARRRPRRRSGRSASRARACRSPRCPSPTTTSS